MTGSLDHQDIRVIDGREVILLIVIFPDGTTRAQFRGVALSEAVRLLRDLADQWEQQAAA